MQLTRDVLKDNEQYFPRTTLWRSVGKLYGWFCYTSQNNEEIERKDNSIFEDCRETQPVF